MYCHDGTAEWYIILAICAVVAALFTVYHDQIVKWLTPYAQKLKELVIVMAMTLNLTAWNLIADLPLA